ncbi:RagB/SusD family nutrient uptake outer membrane protein [uncultured Draconibacterium sp.]|uniref:RagB/SusD family nutrient uptake outer membrane protein n=1 Tax=uncultured Draconibacterium sp. TaxID=1573823 RepID=UPI0029C8A05C|nr:RagB/SusD family nutrient uptake outer membrane protein [uncultured Draconibacterium sp.]
MKNIFIILIAFLICTVVSCDEENLNLSPSKETEISFFQTQEGFEKGVMGVYQKLRTMYGHQQINMMGIWLLPDDNLTSLGSHACETFSSMSPDNGNVRDLYKYLYELIGRANVMLAHLNTIEEGIFESDDLKNSITGEVLFLRGYANYFIWNFWGGAAPLVNERITSFDEIAPPSAGNNALLDQAIADFKEAAELLPVNWAADQRGRATQNSANGFLGKALVFRGTVTQNHDDFIAALNAFNKISNVALAPMYQDNFSVFKENNVESLFEVQVSDRPIATGVWSNDDNSSNGFTAGSWDFFNNGYFNWNNPRYLPTEALIDAYIPEDPRFDFSIVWSEKNQETQIGKYVTDNAFIFSRPEGKSLSINNPRLLRYADVILLKAECLVRTGGSLSEAISLINEIRERARKSIDDGTVSIEPADLPLSETDAQKILEWIFYERRIELAAEESHRWFDIRRRHIAGEIDLRNWNFSSLKTDFNFTEKNIYLPLPAYELELNPNLVQNPGY